MSFNKEKKQDDRQTRERLLERTEEKLKMTEWNVGTERWKTEKTIAKRLFTWINRWHVGRFFSYDYSEGRFVFSRNEEKIAKYEAIDGFYVITTDVAHETLNTEQTHAKYMLLANVEQVFRTMKTTDPFLYSYSSLVSQPCQGACLCVYVGISGGVGCAP